MKKLFEALFISGLGLTSVYGCTLFKETVSKFDPSEFIFIGKVVGYTGPVEFDGQKANGSLKPMSLTYVDRIEEPRFVTYGLVVEAVESVHLPIKSNHFEIFEYTLGADCLVQGVSQFYLPDHYPLNSEVRVISKRASLLLGKSKALSIRLENRLTEDGSIALNIDHQGKRMTSADTIFDYKAYSYDMNRDSDSKYLLPVFEIRKELFRLSKLKDQVLRNQILDRIFHAPSNDISHGEIFKNHTSSDSEYRRYFEAYLKMTSPETYVQHKAVQDALDRLSQLGYTKFEAEKAIGKALEEGTDFDANKLFDASLKFLPVRKRK